MIVDADGLRAVIDWELVHLGDPVEDLAWMCVKAWRFRSPLPVAGVGTVDELLGAYEAASRPGGRPRRVPLVAGAEDAGSGASSAWGRRRST